MARAILLVVCVSIVLASACGAQTYKMDWCCIGAGGGAASARFGTLQCTIGQPAAGCVNKASFLHWIGFWASDAPTPMVCATPAMAKLQADGTLVSIAGSVVSSADGDLYGCFYVQKPDRSSGIRIAASPSSVQGLARGSVVNVIGTIGTTADGEKQITGPMVIIVSTTSPPSPLGMLGKSIGGGDLGAPPLGQYGIAGKKGLNNIGLLVKACGYVTDAGPGYVAVDDGSGPVTVDTRNMAYQPMISTYIMVTGISSLYASSGSHFSFLLPRTEDDIDW